MAERPHEREFSLIFAFLGVDSFPFLRASLAGRTLRPPIGLLALGESLSRLWRDSFRIWNGTFQSLENNSFFQILAGSLPESGRTPSRVWKVTG